MKVLHVLFGLAILVLVITGTAFLVKAALSEPFWEQALDQISASRFLAIHVAAGSLLVVLLYVLTGIPRAVKEQFISFENEGGMVCISMKAVRDFLIRLGDEFAAVLHLEPLLDGSSGKIDVVLNLRVRSGTQIPEVCRMLQDRVRESLRDNLGLADVGGVRVNVKEIVSAPVEKGARTEAAGEWEGSMRA